MQQRLEGPDTTIAPATMAGSALPDAEVEHLATYVAELAG